MLPTVRSQWVYAIPNWGTYVGKLKVVGREKDGDEKGSGIAYSDLATKLKTLHLHQGDISIVSFTLERSAKNCVSFMNELLFYFLRKLF